MIIASHRGPFKFERDEGGGFSAVRGAGGVVSALGPLLLGGERTDATWVAAAVSDTDRAAVEAGAAQAPGVDLHLMALDPDQHRLHYDVVSNSVLWFVNHGLFDLIRRPRFDDRFTEAWAAYVAVNQRFADEIVSAADPDEAVLVQDYQLALVPGMVRAARPTQPVCYFHHTPFAGPGLIEVLPRDVADAIVESLAGVPAGFHARRWARAYEASVRLILDRDPASAFIAPLGVDVAALEEITAASETAMARAEIEEMAADRKLIFRTDRMEPSKNIVRGFLAYDLLLERRPDWRGRVVFLAGLYASREALPEYLAYANEVNLTVERINSRWGTDDWSPVVLEVRDDYPRSVAGLQCYDVLLVNPISDGLNLVAKEGPLVNRRDGVVCLSPEAGAYEELADAVIECHPYDLGATASALAQALDEPAPDRAERARRLIDLAGARTPSDWLRDQLTAVGAA